MSAPLAYTVRSFCEATGTGKTKFYEMVARGEIRTVKNGKTTLILGAEVERWLAALPQTYPHLSAGLQRSASNAPERRGRGRPRKSAA